MPRLCDFAIALCLLPLATAGLSADRPAINLSPATPEEMENHHLVRSAELGTGQTPDGLVPLTPWRTEDDTIEGWDWSLPPGVEPVGNSGLVFGRGERRRLPGNKLADVSVFWKDVEPEEGRYDFESLRRKLEDLPEDIVGYRFHFYGSVAYRTRPGEPGRTTVAPEWLAEYDIPIIDMTPMEGRFQLFNYAIWHPEYHKRYLRVIEALGRSGIPQLDGLHIVYVGGLSKSWGEEMWIPRDVGIWAEQNAGLTPEVLQRCMTERLDAWAEAFKNSRHKLAWVGAGGDGGGGQLDYSEVGQRLVEHAYRVGMGQRCGFVENYLYHLNTDCLGQSVDDDGYLIVDEWCPPIAGRRAFGDENEEYGRYWTGRFGPLETHPYRYHQSMIRSLQMRRNYLWMSASSIDMDPALTAYMSLALGRTATDSPDAFCHLRESMVRAGAAGKQGDVVPIKNFERWLTQRDRDGYRTVPVLRAAQHEMMWMVPDGHKYDMVARRTDLATGNSRIGFALDDKFVFGGPHRVAIKVTYHDLGSGRWTLVCSGFDAERAIRRTVACGDSGRVLTRSFLLDAATFPGRGDAFDLHIEAEKEDATLSFVRVIKL